MYWVGKTIPKNVVRISPGRRNFYDANYIWHFALISGEATTVLELFVSIHSQKQEMFSSVSRPETNQQMRARRLHPLVKFLRDSFVFKKYNFTENKFEITFDREDSCRQSLNQQGSF